MLIIGIEYRNKVRVRISCIDKIFFETSSKLSLNGWGLYVFNDLDIVKAYLQNNKEKDMIYFLSRDKNNYTGFLVKYFVITNDFFDPFYQCLIIEVVSVSEKIYRAVLKKITINKHHSIRSHQWYYHTNLTQEEYEKRDIKRAIKEIHNFYKNIILESIKKAEVFLLNFHDKYKNYGEYFIDENNINKHKFTNETNETFLALSDKTTIVDYKNTIIIDIPHEHRCKPYRNKKITSIISIEEKMKMILFIIDKRYYSKIKFENTLRDKTGLLYHATQKSFSYIKDDISKSARANIFFYNKPTDVNKNVFLLYTKDTAEIYILFPIFDEEDNFYDCYIYKSDDFILITIRIDLLYMYCPHTVNSIKNSPYQHFVFVRKGNSYNYHITHLPPTVNLFVEKCLRRSNENDEENKNNQNLNFLIGNILSTSNQLNVYNYLQLYKISSLTKKDKIKYYGVNESGERLTNFEIENFINEIKNMFYPKNLKEINDFLINLYAGSYWYSIVYETENLVGYLYIFEEERRDYFTNKPARVFIIYDKLQNLMNIVEKIKEENSIFIESGKMYKEKNSILNRSSETEIYVYFIFLLELN